MVKSIVVARRKAGMNRKEFYKYWEQTHGPLAAKMIPGLRRYVQNHFVDVPGMEYDGDGVVEMWYDDIDSYLKSMEYLHSEEGRPLMEDGDNFADMTDAKVWIVEEHVIL
jgi:uncharacterized protein (TIGR02118 family)